MAENRPVIVYLEQVRSRAANMCVTRSETVLHSKGTQRHERLDIHADGRAVGSAFLRELHWVLNAEENAQRLIPNGSAIVVYSSNEIAIKNYGAFLAEKRTGVRGKVMNYKDCEAIYDVCQKRGYALSFSVHSLLSQSVRNTAMATLIMKSKSCKKGRETQND